MQSHQEAIPIAEHAVSNLLWLTLLIIIIISVVWLLAVLVVLTQRNGLFFRKFFTSVPHTTAPWGMPEVLFVALFYFALLIFSQTLVFAIFPVQSLSVPETQNLVETSKEQTEVVPTESQIEPETRNESDALRKKHPLTVLMSRAADRPIILIVCFLAAVVFAPISEELFFRVILQGGLESTLRKYVSSKFLCAVLPVLFSSALFAAMHFRSKMSTTNDDGVITQIDVDKLFNMMLASIIANALAVWGSIAFFAFVTRASWADLGLRNFRQYRRDFMGALFLFLLMVIPIFTLQISLHTLLSGSIVTDPAPLFFLALVLGTLYFRTKNMAPIVFLHAILNGFSFLMLLLSVLRNW